MEASTEESEGWILLSSIQLTQLSCLGGSVGPT